MKNPEQAVKKWIYGQLGNEVGGFKYYDFPPTEPERDERYIWINTQQIIESGTKDSFITEVLADITLVVRVQSAYNSSLSLEKGKDAVMPLLIKRGLNVTESGFKLISSNLESSTNDYEMDGNIKLNYCKLNIIYNCEQINN